MRNLIFRIRFWLATIIAPNQYIQWSVTSSCIVDDYITKNDPDCLNQDLQFIYRIVHGCNILHSCSENHKNWRAEAKAYFLELTKNYEKGNN